RFNEYVEHECLWKSPRALDRMPQYPDSMPLGFDDENAAFAGSLFSSPVDLSKTFLAAADASCDESCHARFKAEASRRTPGRRYCWNSLAVISLNEIFTVKQATARFR